MTLQFDLEPQHRRRGARGAGGHQRGARRPAGHAAQQPDLPQGQPGRRAGDDPRAHLEDDDAGADLRRGLEHRQPAPGAGRGRRRRRDRRRLAAGGARRAAAVRAQPLRHQHRGRARRDPGRNANRPKGAIEGGGRRLQIYTQTPALRARRLRADGDRLAQRRGGAPAATSPTSSTASRTRARSASSTASRRSSCWSRASPAPTSSRPSTACARCCPSCRRSCRPTSQLARRFRQHHLDPRLAARGRAHAGRSRSCWSCSSSALFLRSVRATLVPAVATSSSLLGTFGVMYLLGFSLNNLSLMALTVATGFVVDDAIVVLENTSRHIEAGHGPHAGGAARRARGRLHGALDQPLAGRRVHPAALHGGAGRAAVPRVRGDAVGGGADLARHLADDDADDVRLAARRRAARRRSAGRPGACARWAERGYAWMLALLRSAASTGRSPAAAW